MKDYSKNRIKILIIIYITTEFIKINLIFNFIKQKLINNYSKYKY